MFTVEIKINGSLIGHIYGHNEGIEESGDTKYTFEYYRPDSRKLINGNVLFKREDGIEKLISKILSQASKEIHPV